MDSTQEIHDGRRRRSASSRRKIIEAMLELVREGVVTPSADAVALRAGVGRRTVFRLFSDMESIYAEMLTIIREQLGPVQSIPLVGDTPAERLHSLIDRRALVLEEVLHILAAASAHRHRSPRLQANYAAVRQEFREVLHSVLGDQLAPEADAREALDAVLSHEMWRRLRLEQGLDAARSKAILHFLAGAIINPS